MGHEHLPATPDTCFWGFLDGAQPPSRTVTSGARLTIEAITHHAGDAPDLMMDPGVTAIWEAIPPAERGPGVHIMTGPIHVEGAKPGDTLSVAITAMRPRLPYGSNCAANWGLCYDTFGKERITIYELVDPPADGEFPAAATPRFGFDFTTIELYSVPGVVTPPDADSRQPFSRPVTVPVRPHLGVIGVAPDGERRSSIPPGVWGGNVDNWRFGPGVTIHYPVFHEGAGFYVGDPHFAQGDGEICGTAIEASLDVDLRLAIGEGPPVDSPLLETATHWYTHGFGDDLDAAMRMAADQALRLIVDRGGYTPDEAYSLASVAVDLGVTQVVDGTVGCHAAVAKALLGD
jgi:acetamidase/formamidase